MKLEQPTRQYNQTARAEAAEQTERNILAAAVALWREHHLDDITLQTIAERAGVTVQTVIRRFGSKNGVIEAAIERDAGGIIAQREIAGPGEVERALDDLLAHYERDGDAVLRTLSVEDRFPIARKIATTGRHVHRAACARVFGPHLPHPDDPAYTARLDTFVAATDIFIWKLLRRDMDRSADETRRVMGQLIDALIAQS